MGAEWALHDRMKHEIVRSPLFFTESRMGRRNLALLMFHRWCFVLEFRCISISYICTKCFRVRFSLVFATILFLKELWRNLCMRAWVNLNLAQTNTILSEWRERGQEHINSSGKDSRFKCTRFFEEARPMYSVFACNDSKSGKSYGQD